MRALLAAILLLTGPACAQPVPIPRAPTGTVTGHVIFAETRQPSRLVEVTLIRRPEQPEPDFETRLAQARLPERKWPVATITGRTGLDGTFTLRDVPPGEYYALARLPGYLPPVQPPPDEKTAADPDAFMHDIPRVVVRARTASQVDLELRRGASLSGRIRFDDGAPVVGASVTAEQAEEPARMYFARPSYLYMAVHPWAEQILTDSDGRFLIAGLRPGRYNLRASITISGGGRSVDSGSMTRRLESPQKEVSIPVYAPAAFHKSDARIIEIKGSERISDLQVEIRTTELHSIRGTVAAMPDRHAPADARVLLTDPTDKHFYRSTRLQSDGSFELPQVPAGTYSLKLSEARDVADPDALEAYPVVLQQFAEATVPVIVVHADVSLPAILLEPVQKTPKP